MRFAELLGDILFVELANVVDDWLWRGGRVDNMVEVGFDYFGKLAVERARDRMGSIADGEGLIAWCNYLLRGGHCCVGFTESCSIFLFDYRKIGQSLVQWLVSLSWYI
jgi:hypothetical protein